MKTISDPVYEVWVLGAHDPTQDTQHWREVLARARYIAETKRTKTEVRERPGKVIEYAMDATVYDHRRTPAELRACIMQLRDMGRTPEQISEWMHDNNYLGMELALAVLTGDKEN